LYILLHQGVRKAENKREIKVRKIANRIIENSIWRRLIPELLKAVISPSALNLPKLNIMEKRRETGMMISKKDGKEKTINFNTLKRGALSTNISFVRSNITPTKRMKLKNKNPKTKGQKVSLKM